MKLWLILAVMLIACHRSLVAQRRKNNQQKPLPKCGTLNIIEGDIRTITPWTAAVFTQTRSKSGKMVRKFFTNGVVLGPTTVLSLVGGPFGVTFKGTKSKQYVVPPPEVFIIGAGLNSSNVDETDSIAQFSKVVYVEPTRVVDKTNDYFHFFMYHLETPLNLATPYVRHICIPLLLRNRNPTPYGWQLVQGGFAQSPTNPNAPQILKATKVTTGPKNLCESMFRYHYQHEIDTTNFFCGRRDLVTSFVGATFANVVQSVENKGEVENNFCQLHGSSLTFAIRNVWYAATLVGMIPGRQKGRCGFKSFYIFGSPGPHLDWIQRSFVCSPNFACGDSTCISLNKVCDGNRDCKDGSDEEKDFCDSQNQCARKDKSYSCGLKDKKCISTEDLCNGKRDCDNGNDENPKNCQEKKANSSASLRSINKGSGYCPAIKPAKGVITNCFDETGTSVECNNAISAGSKVELECEPYHTSRYSHDSNKLVCNEKKWIGEKPFTCEPGCGIFTQEQKVVGLPWHVSIAVASVTDGKLEQICGGTLIEKSFLITSTQCVALWVNNVAGRKNYYSVVNPTTAARLKDVDTESSNFQILPLKQVWTYGNTTNSGLAVVKLKKGVWMNGENLPLPACYMVSPFKSLRTGQAGIITGFTLEGSTGSKPVVRNVTIVDRSECTGNGLAVQKKQFCVSMEEGFFPCGGDAGVGVLFKENSAYVLKGVATPGDDSKCNSKFGVVTNVDDHSDWILDVLEANA